MALFCGAAEWATGVEVGVVNSGAEFQQSFEEGFRGGYGGGNVEGRFAAGLACGDIAFLFEEAFGDIPVAMVKGQTNGELAVA